MNTVKFIREIIIEELPYREFIEESWINFPLNIDNLPEDDIKEDVEYILQSRYTPVIRICHTGKSDLYIAYSKAAEIALLTPIKVIHDELETERWKNRKLRSDKILLNNFIRKLILFRQFNWRYEWL